jgi:hypothetical protein
MLPVLNAVAPLAKILFSTIEKSVPDKDLQEKLKAQLQTQLMQSHTQELTAAAKIIEAEAKAGWFASSWRPLLMYVLIFILIWNYVLGPVILFFFKASITITLTRRRLDTFTNWSWWLRCGTKCRIGGTHYGK